MNYQEAISFLENSFISFQTAGKIAYKGGLESISEMCDYLGNPQNSYPVIHVAGTNGKGSVSHMLASALQSAGYRVGLYTSPHLRDFRERVRINGELISEDEVARFVTSHGNKMVEMGLSYFEMTTSMAFDCFAKAKVDIAIIETGLGGRLDATNIIKPILSIITNIGLDHTDILGDTIEKVAAEKAGIIKHGVPVVIGESDSRSDNVFIETAKRVGAPIVFAENNYECAETLPNGIYMRCLLRNKSDNSIRVFDLDLTGDYQHKNVVTLTVAVDILGRNTNFIINGDALAKGLSSVVASTGFLGRWQILSQSPLIIADTGHNVHAMRYLGGQLLEQQCKNIYIIVGFAADKKIDEVLSLLPKNARYIFTQADSPRAMSAEIVASYAKEHGLQGEVIKSVREALQKAKTYATNEDLIFVGGSTFVVAEIL